MKRFFITILVVVVNITTAMAYNFSVTTNGGHSIAFNIITSNNYDHAVEVAYPYTTGGIGPNNPNTYYTGDIIIPEYVTYNYTRYYVAGIESSAFYCSMVTSITIPSTMETIGNGAFQYATSLESITCNCTTPPSLPGGATFTFYGVSSGIPVYIPCGTYNAYAASWSNFQNLIDPKPILNVVSANNQMGTANMITDAICTNGTATIKATANPGYHFVSWNGVNTNNPLTLSFNSSDNGQSYTATAYFEQNPMYTITVNSNNTTMGTVTGGGTYAAGTTATISATPNNGYIFVRWQDNNTSNPRNITVTDNETYTAFFQSNNSAAYTITANSNDPAMGSVSGGGTYNSGATATLTAIANNGYHFVRWNDNDTSNPRAITVTGNATYTAYFEANQSTSYTIAVVSQNPSMGAVTGGGTFSAGISTTITAEPFSGYRFVQWQDGNTQRIRTITVIDNATYTAYFDYLNGIDDITDADDVKVYARGGRIVIDFSGYLAAGSRQPIIVYDVRGRVIKRATDCGQHAAIEIPVTSAGVYMVKIGNGKPHKVLVRP